MRNKNAFTLLEILIALLIFSIIGAIIGGSYIAGNKINTSQEGVIEIQQNLRVAFGLMKRDLRMSGYEYTPHWDLSVARTLNQITANAATQTTALANTNNISVTYLVPVGGSIIPTVPAAIQYYVDSANKLQRVYSDTQVATNDTIATNIAAFWITYLVDNGDGTSSWVNAPTILTRAVGITMVGQSAKVNKAITSAQTFTDPNLAANNKTLPAGYDYRMESTVVELKNMNSIL